MPPSKSDTSDAIVKKNSLIQAVLSGWNHQGTGELSARTIAASAGISPSAIYYYFDDVEHLYEAASHEAMAQARLWCDAQMAQFGALHIDGARPGDVVAAMMATLIDELCSQDRTIALAWREAHILAARSPEFSTLWAGWDQLWRNFWLGICRRLGIEADADFCHNFFDGEVCLHLMRWNRTGDRASLDEITRGFGAFLDGAPLPPAPWRAMLKQQAIQSIFVADRNDAFSRNIAQAATELLALGGIGAITHRAVAARAGLTLGTVSHHFKRADDLLRLAYHETYHILTGLSPNPAEPGTFTPMANNTPTLRRTLAIDELVLAVARGRADSSLALALRYLRGRTSQFAIAETTSLNGQPLALAAGIASSIMMGVLHRTIHETDEIAADIRQAVHQDMLRRLVAGGRSDPS